jgi:hypothetical protein
MIRRILFLGLTFGLADLPSLQIHFFTYQTVLYVIYIGLVAPHDLYLTTFTELGNETLLVLICYHFILLTDITKDRILRWNIGWSLIAVVGVILVVNFSIIFGVSAKAMFR